MPKKEVPDTKTSKEQTPGPTAGKAEGSESTVDKALKNKDNNKKK